MLRLTILALALFGASAQEPSGTYTGTAKVLGLSVTESLTANDDSTFDLAVTGAFTFSCTGEKFTIDEASGTITPTDIDTDGDCLHDALAANSLSFGAASYESGADTISLTVTALGIPVTSTLTHTALAAAVAPSGTYTGTAKVLGLSADESLTANDDSTFDLAVSGAFTFSCTGEKYTIDDSGAITPTDIDTTGDCLHDALAANSLSFGSAAYDSGADTISLTVTALGIPVTSTLRKASTEFMLWAGKHGLTYESEEEFKYRFGIWLANKAIVEAHNEEYARGRVSYTLAMNKFAAMTNAEFSSAMLRPRSTRNADSAERTFEGGVSVADTFDWRSVKDVVTPIKDQGQCGSCWAFSAVATMEGAYNYASGSLNSFSEQELVDCTNSGHYTCNVGGEMSDGVDYIASSQSGYIYTETAYPYTATSCSILKNCCSAESNTGVNTGITGHTAITSGDEDALKSAAGTYPVISVGIDASSTQFQLYSSGVYAPAGCSSSSLDHGVAVVGYDTMMVGGDYWIVKNSWGTGWGEDGYIYMARNDNNKCGIATDACYANI